MLKLQKSLKREQEVHVLAEEPKSQESVDENTRAMKDQGRGRDRERIVGRCTGQDWISARSFVCDEVSVTTKKQQEDDMWKELEVYVFQVSTCDRMYIT